MNDEVQSIAVEVLTDSQYIMEMIKTYEFSCIPEWKQHHERMTKIAGQLQALEVCQR